MTAGKLLSIIYNLTQQKRLKVIKIWDVIANAQQLEDVDEAEIWMLVRTLERRGSIYLIGAEKAGIVAVSVTPLGKAMVPDGVS